MLRLVRKILSCHNFKKKKKEIMATNRHDTLDPALLRPGRLDRKIEFPNPDRRQKRLIFQVCTAKMNLSEEIDLEDFVQRPEKLSAADVSAICQVRCETNCTRPAASPSLPF